MMKNLLVWGTVGALWAGMGIAAGTGTVLASGDGPKPGPDPGSQQFFSTRVQEIFASNCYSCHDQTAKGGLRLDSYAFLLQGGDDGAVIVPGNPDASQLIQAVRRTGDLTVPP